MKISQKREALKGAYLGQDGNPSQRWLDKINAMTDAQVTAIYLRLKGQGKV